MKKIALISLLSLYAIATLGISISQFYCCGKLKSTNITLAHESKQHCGKEDKKDGCCKTKYQSIKVKDDHVAADIINIPAKHFSDLHLYTPSFDALATVNVPKSVANAPHAPPLKEQVPVYILNCVYRI